MNVQRNPHMPSHISFKSNAVCVSIRFERFARAVALVVLGPTVKSAITEACEVLRSMLAWTLKSAGL